MSCIRSCYEKDSPNFGHEDCGTCIHGDRPPQQKQEPVAMQMDVIVVNLVREGINKHRARELAEHFTKHTSPPQRQPLSFDEVEDCFPDGGSSNEYGEVVVSPQWLHDFAAAVQRAAHGITGEQK
jgi:hypothetical protein